MANTDKIGKRYGHLVVLGIDYERDKKGYYLQCKCDCGKIISVYKYNLRDNNTGQKSCGCTRIGKKIRDLTGMRFGELTAIECVGSVGQNPNKTAVWRCLCSCGNFVNVRQNNLVSGHTISCGCKKTAAHSDATARVAGLKKSEKTGRFETNIRAKKWTLVSPNGQIYHIKNLSLFVRENAEIFGIRNIDVETKRQMKRLSDAAHRGYKCDGWTIKCDE